MSRDPADYMGCSLLMIVATVCAWVLVEALR